MVCTEVKRDQPVMSLLVFSSYQDWTEPLFDHHKEGLQTAAGHLAHSERWFADCPPWLDAEVSHQQLLWGPAEPWSAGARLVCSLPLSAIQRCFISSLLLQLKNIFIHLLKNLVCHFSEQSLLWCSPRSWNLSSRSSPALVPPTVTIWMMIVSLLP